MPFRCNFGPFTENEELSLDELLAEPIVRSIMARDNVEDAQVRQIAAEIRERFARNRRKQQTSIDETQAHT